MRLSKKGDLALSTNAIVVLIIAVIMLGLIITFVSQGFGAVSDKFFGEVEKMPNPITPSSSNPITTSDVIVKGRGDDFGFKVAVYNPGGDATGVEITLENCDDVLGSGGVIKSGKRDIASRKSQVFTVVGKIADDAKSGKNLCQVRAEPVYLVGSSAPNIQDADIVLQIKE